MTPVRRAFFDSPLGQAHYVEAGEPTGIPVVLLHQTPRSTDEFAEVVPLFSTKRWTIALDTPGYGCSDPVAGEPTIEDYASVVLSLARHLGAPTIDLVGHHTGALIAVECAAKAPDEIRRIVLSGPMFMDERTRLDLARHFSQWTIQPGGGHLTEKWKRFAAWTKDDALVQRLVVDLFRAGPQSEQGHFAVVKYQMENRAPLVRCPILLLYARGDLFSMPDENRRLLRSAFPEAAEAVIDGSVFIANESPVAFAKAAIEFLEGGLS